MITAREVAGFQRCVAATEEMNSSVLFENNAGVRRFTLAVKRQSVNQNHPIADVRKEEGRSLPEVMSDRVKLRTRPSGSDE